ncbi:phosphoribosylanthranilate isomerase, partial [bacterium]|nr:phosphoribosylanthranilate isomerase [bacterium]
MTRVKICCIANTPEMQMAVAAGASAVGLVSEMPSGPGVISETKIAEIASVGPVGIASFLLTSKISADEIILQQQKGRTNTSQLVDAILL